MGKLVSERFAMNPHERFDESEIRAAEHRLETAFDAVDRTAWVFDYTVDAVFDSGGEHAVVGPRLPARHGGVDASADGGVDPATSYRGARWPRDRVGRGILGQRVDREPTRPTSRCAACSCGAGRPTVCGEWQWSASADQSPTNQRPATVAHSHRQIRSFQRAHMAERRSSCRPDSRSLGRRSRLDVLVVVEHVLGVVLGFHFGEPPVGVIAVGLADAARVVVGVEEVHVDAGTVGLQGVEE